MSFPLPGRLVVRLLDRALGLALPVLLRMDAAAVAAARVALLGRRLVGGGGVEVRPAVGQAAVVALEVAVVLVGLVGVRLVDLRLPVGHRLLSTIGDR